MSVIINSNSFLHLDHGTSAKLDIVCSFSGTLEAIGAVFSPAAQSVALVLYAKKGCVESGILFGPGGAILLIQVIRCVTGYYNNLSSLHLWIRVYEDSCHISSCGLLFFFAATISTSFCVLSFIGKRNEYHRLILKSKNGMRNHLPQEHSKALESLNPPCTEGNVWASRQFLLVAIMIIRWYVALRLADIVSVAGRKVCVLYFNFNSPRPIYKNIIHPYSAQSKELCTLKMI